MKLEPSDQSGDLQQDLTIGVGLRADQIIKLSLECPTYMTPGFSHSRVEVNQPFNLFTKSVRPLMILPNTADSQVCNYLILATLTKASV
jgi:hypothetical protein